MMLTVGSLFSGIGGIELGLERTGGFKTIWQAEIEPFPAYQILPKHWKDVPNIGDVTKGRWLQYERPDLLCGGFPCQPVSFIGQKQAQRDPRWLWPMFSEAIRVLRPCYILVENTPGLLNAGMGDVLADLASLGYDAEWQSLSAAAFGATHIRERVFIVAYPFGITESQAYSTSITIGTKQDPWDDVGWFSGAERPTPVLVFRDNPPEPDWSVYQSGVIGVDDGIPYRVDRAKSLGNAVVPQVTQWIGEQILRFDKEVSH